MVQPIFIDGATSILVGGETLTISGHDLNSNVQVFIGSDECTNVRVSQADANDVAISCDTAESFSVGPKILSIVTDSPVLGQIVPTSGNVLIPLMSEVSFDTVVV